MLATALLGLLAAAGLLRSHFTILRMGLGWWRSLDSRARGP